MLFRLRSSSSSWQRTTFDDGSEFFMPSSPILFPPSTETRGPHGDRAESLVIPVSPIWLYSSPRNVRLLRGLWRVAHAVIADLIAVRHFLRAPRTTGDLFSQGGHTSISNLVTVEFQLLQFDQGTNGDCKYNKHSVVNRTSVTGELPWPLPLRILFHEMGRNLTCSVLLRCLEVCMPCKRQQTLYTMCNQYFPSISLTVFLSRAWV